jgi:hypothetical protein
MCSEWKRTWGYEEEEVGDTKHDENEYRRKLIYGSQLAWLCTHFMFKLLCTVEVHTTNTYHPEIRVKDSRMKILFPASPLESLTLSFIYEAAPSRIRITSPDCSVVSKAMLVVLGRVR